MLDTAKAIPTIAVRDVSTARNFYEKRLGLKFKGQEARDHIRLEAGGGTSITVYQRPGHTPAQNTVLSFDVKNVEETVRKLKEQGVEFEEYDLPDQGIKTKNGVAEMDGVKAAWFKDPDGNILAIGEWRG